MPMLIKKATILSPGSKFHLKKKDLLISNGMIQQIADKIETKSKIVIEEKNLFVSDGWVDVFADFCDPGHEHRETLESGMRAAAAGGYTDVLLLPNTKPGISNKAMVEAIRQQSQLVNLHPIGALSKNLEGKDLAEMYDMHFAGAKAFSDGHLPVQNAGLMLKALQYVKTFNGVIVQIPEEKTLSSHGLMNEGYHAVRLGVAGKPDIAESILIQRDLDLLEYTNSQLHFTGVSTKRGIELIRQAKKKGLNVTCSVNPVHLIFTEEHIGEYNSLFKINPPLRTESDRKALLKALNDGVIDCFASHHLPQDWDAKEVEFEYAAPGMIGLQTMLNMMLMLESNLKLEQVVQMLSASPRKIFNLPESSISEGQAACMNVFSTDQVWLYDKQANQSKSTNSPFMNQQVKGQVLAVVNNHQTYRLTQTSNIKEANLHLKTATK
jgi:dihydroorotase